MVSDEHQSISEMIFSRHSELNVFRELNVFVEEIIAAWIAEKNLKVMREFLYVIFSSVPSSLVDDKFQASDDGRKGH